MAKSKPKRKHRIWRTLLLALGGIALFLLLFVAAFLFNPFEGSLPEMRDVVPRGVNFFVRKQRLADDFDPFPVPKFWAELRGSRGFDVVANGSIGQDLRRQGLDRALAEAEQTFAQIRQDSSGFLDVLRDVIGRELIVAGYEQDYSQSPARPLAQPWWCVYTRIDWRIKATLGLAGFGFVQGKLAANGLDVKSQDDLLVVTPRNAEPVYVARHLDVLMIANQPRLIEQSRRLIAGSRDEEPIGQMAAYTDGAIARIDRWAEVNRIDRPNVVEFVVEPNAFDGFRQFAAAWPNPQAKDSMNERVLASFLNLKGWTQVAGGLMFADQVLAATGQVDLNSRQHTQFQSTFYSAEQQRREEWLDPFLRMVPASACAAAALRVPAGDFLHAMFEALEQDEKNLINDSLRRATFQGTQLNDVRDLIERLSIAFRQRSGFVFRRNTPDLSRDEKTGELMVPVAARSPMPQVAWVFWLRPNGAPLVDELVTMLSTYYTTFGFRKVWHLKVPFEGGALPEPVTEFTNPQIPATGEIAMIVFRDFFVVSNSGPLIRDILRTRYGNLTGARSMRDLPEFDAAEREMPPSLNGLIWLDGKNLVPVLDDYLEFAAVQSAEPDAEWQMLMRPTAEDQVRRLRFPQYPSKASMPKTLIEGDFEQAVREWMRAKWEQERSNFTAADRAQMEQLRGVCQLLKAAAIQLELQNNYIRYQARIMADLR